MSIEVKRAYEPPARSDGYRVLVDRIWPRGITKDDLEVDAWLKDVAPSPPFENGSGTTRRSGTSSGGVTPGNSSRMRPRSANSSSAPELATSPWSSAPRTPSTTTPSRSRSIWSAG